MSRFLFFLLLLSVESFSQVSTLRRFQSDLDRFNETYEPEFANLLLDKDYYFTGDKIWYALQLRNIPFAPNSLSTVAYVEIRDKRDSVLIRQKIKCKLGSAHGELHLSRQLPTGTYEIVAFTQWMKNSNAGAFVVRVPILNLDMRAVLPLETEGKEQVMVESGDGHVIKVSNPSGGTRKGRWLLTNLDEVFSQQPLEKESEVILNPEKQGPGPLYLFVLDSTGNVSDVRLARSGNSYTMLKLTQDRSVSPRKTASVWVELRDAQGNLVQGNVSISVRPRALVGKVDSCGVPAGLDRMFNASIDPVFIKKELFTYPVSSNSLPEVAFSGRMTPDPWKIPAGALESMELAEVRTRLMKPYDLQWYFQSQQDYNIRPNLSLLLADYHVMPSLEEFINEIIVQLKVRKVKGEKVLRVRTQDDPNRIHFFSGSPLMLVDGYHVASAEEMLKIPTTDVERIDIIWGMHEINSLNVFGLADNGVVSLTTKSSRRVQNTLGNFFGSLHTPLIFSLPVSADQEKIPVLIDPVYWNPSVHVNGREKFTFTTTDEIGELLVIVRGYTLHGEFVSGQAIIQSAIRP